MEDFVKSYKKRIISLSILITVIGFIISITGEIKNKKVKNLSTEDEKLQSIEESETYGFIGIVMLFIGFLLNNMVTIFT
jgi:hypothetical protein